MFPLLSVSYCHSQILSWFPVRMTTGARPPPLWPGRPSTASLMRTSRGHLKSSRTPHPWNAVVLLGLSWAAFWAFLPSWRLWPSFCSLSYSGVNLWSPAARRAKAFMSLWPSSSSSSSSRPGLCSSALHVPRFHASSSFAASWWRWSSSSWHPTGCFTAWGCWSPESATTGASWDTPFRWWMHCCSFSIWPWCSWRWGT